MITLNDSDAAFVRAVLSGLLSDDLEPCDEDEPDVAALLHDARNAIDLLTHGSKRPDAITDPCHCNQPDQYRDHRHQRGDENVCRDTIDAARDR